MEGEGILVYYRATHSSTKSFTHALTLVGVSYFNYISLDCWKETEYLEETHTDIQQEEHAIVIY